MPKAKQVKNWERTCIIVACVFERKISFFSHRRMCSKKLWRGVGHSQSNMITSEWSYRKRSFQYPDKTQCLKIFFRTPGPLGCGDPVQLSRKKNRDSKYKKYCPTKISWYFDQNWQRKSKLLGPFKGVFFEINTQIRFWRSIHNYAEKKDTAITNWSCKYSSISCSPVTSGAPSETTISDNFPSKWPIIWFAVSSAVISPCSCITPSMGAIFCRSTATTVASGFLKIHTQTYYYSGCRGTLDNFPCLGSDSF